MTQSLSADQYGLQTLTIYETLSGSDNQLKPSRPPNNIANTRSACEGAIIGTRVYNAQCIDCLCLSNGAQEGAGGDNSR